VAAPARSLARIESDLADDVVVEVLETLGRDPEVASRLGLESVDEVRRLRKLSARNSLGRLCTASR
jgi:hypothetical protein